MKSLFEEMIGIAVPGDYAGSDEGIVRIGARRDYDWLTAEKDVRPDGIIPLGYSLGSGVTVEPAATKPGGGLILRPMPDK